MQNVKTLYDNLKLLYNAIISNLKRRIYMDFLKEIIISALYNNRINLSVDFGDVDIANILTIESAKTLKKIHNELCDDTLDDFQCIENIIHLYENMGINCKNRHDF